MIENAEDKIDAEVGGWIKHFSGDELTILSLCNDGQPTDAARCFIYALKIKALIANLNKEDLEINKKVLTEMEELHNSILETTKKIMPDDEEETQGYSFN